MKLRILFGQCLLASVLHTPAKAQTLSFTEVWDKIQSESDAMKASDSAREAAAAARSRASRHWLPRVFLDARGYETNDPGASFFGLLQQRELTSADFNADQINHPDKSTYIRGALGIDLPLYEGGMRTAQVRVQTHLSAAKMSEASQVRLEQYAQVSETYAGLSVLNRQATKLTQLNAELEKLIASYRLGSKSNPLGYSGLLGMRSLVNRIQGRMQQYEAQRKSYYSALAEMGLRQEGWTPEDIESERFVVRYLETTTNGRESFQIASARDSALAATEFNEIEKARFLPRVGAFAETYTFGGKRGSADGYSAGLYLQWNLFDPSDFGRLREARLKAIEANHTFEAFRRKERAEQAAHQEALKALRSNLNLLKQSDGLLSEQTTMTSTLFRNGSISALQVVEMLNRRTDLIDQQTQTELQLLKTAAEVIRRQPFALEQTTSSGGPK